MDWTCAQRKSQCQLNGSINEGSELMEKAEVLQLVARCQGSAVQESCLNNRCLQCWWVKKSQSRYLEQGFSFLCV